MANAFRVTLMMFGVIFILVVGLGIALFCFNPFNVEKLNTASRSDVQFIFNWSGLNLDQEFSIPYSYESKRDPIVGDHIDIYCLQLSDISIKVEDRGNWVAGPEKNPLFVKARQRVLQDALHGKDAEPCLGSNIEINSDEALSHFAYLVLSDRRITDYTIFLLHVPSKRLLAVDFAS